MKKYSYFSPDVYHYLYVDDDDNAAYEKYNIDDAVQSSGLNNLPNDEQEEWMSKAYDAEEEELDSEQGFIDKFLENFQVDTEVQAKAKEIGDMYKCDECGEDFDIKIEFEEDSDLEAGPMSDDICAYPTVLECPNCGMSIVGEII